MFVGRRDTHNKITIVTFDISIGETRKIAIHYHLQCYSLLITNVSTFQLRKRVCTLICPTENLAENQFEVSEYLVR